MRIGSKLFQQRMIRCCEVRCIGGGDVSRKDNRPVNEVTKKTGMVDNICKNKI